MLVNLKEYHRPDSLDEALSLLNRKDVRTFPLAGGTQLLMAQDAGIDAVVDLQDLGLDTISFSDGEMSLGCMVRLQTLYEELADEADGLLAEAASLMGGWNLRNHMTVGGTLGAGDFHSPLSVVLAALDAEVLVLGETKELIPMHELASRDTDLRVGLPLIMGVSFTYLDVQGSYQQVARTEADRPIVSAACVIHQEEGGERLALTIGGFTGELFYTTMPLDDGVLDGLIQQVRSAGAEKENLQSDFLGDADYRAKMAEVLTRRVYQEAIDRVESVG